MPDPVITLAHVRKSFGRTTVFGDVSLELCAGSVFGLVGLNGAGKTTLIRILLGLLKPDNGTCRVLGHEPWRHQTDLYRMLGVVLEHNGFWGNLSVAQNMRFFAKAKGIGRPDLEAYLREQWATTAIIEKKGKVKYFSRGEKMQCALCRAFLGWPRLYLLDEPAIALDIKAYDHFCGLVRRAREQGATVVISSHQLDAIEDLCDSVGILENGTITFLPAKKQGRRPWLIRAQMRPEYGAVIREMTGGETVYRDGAWRFDIHPADTRVIGAMVTKLAAMGCDIGEVREESAGLRESLRKYYGPSRDNGVV